MAGGGAYPSGFEHETEFTVDNHQLITELTLLQTLTDIHIHVLHMANVETLLDDEEEDMQI